MATLMIGFHLMGVGERGPVSSSPTNKVSQFCSRATQVTRSNGIYVTNVIARTSCCKLYVYGYGAVCFSSKKVGSFLSIDANCKYNELQICTQSFSVQELRFSPNRHHWVCTWNYWSYRSKVTPYTCTEIVRAFIPYSIPYSVPYSVPFRIPCFTRYQ